MAAKYPVYAGNGQTVYAQIQDAADGQIANGVGLEAYNQANWADYVISSVEDLGASRYLVTIPGYLPADRKYIISLYIATVMGAPAAGDIPHDFDLFDWDGANFIGLASGLNVGKINGSAPAAVNLALSATQLKLGVVEAGTLTSTQMTTDLVATVANIYAGRVLYFTSGVNTNLAVLITAYVVAGGKLTFVAFNNQPAPAAPSALDTFLII